MHHIVSRLEGGLGNQLFQYAAGRSVAARLGWSLALDTRTVAESQERPYGLDAFFIAATPLSAVDRLRVRLSLKAPARRLGAALVWASSPLTYEHLRDEERGYDPRVAAIRAPTYMTGFWQSPRYFEGIRQTLLSDLEFRRPPSPRNAELLRTINGQNAVCVHIRRGDYLSPHLREKHAPCEPAYYQSALSFIRERVADPHVYVFSDEPAWAADNLRFDVPVTIVDHNYGPDSREDMRLMRACRHFIIANSSFSWWGAWLAAHPDPLVVCPRRWFGIPHGSVDDIVPTSWVRM